MTALAITRWISLRTLRSPTAWALLLLSALSWPAWLQFTPVGVTTGSRDSVALVYEVAFLFLLLGAALGLQAIERIDPVLRRATPLVRVATGWLAVASSAVLWSVVAAAWPWALGAVGEGGAAGLGLLLAAAHLATLAALLLAAPLPRGARSFGLVLLAWWLPALTSGTGPVAAWLRGLFDVAGTLRSPSEGWSLPALATTIGPMISLWLTAWLLAARRGARTAHPS